VKCVKWHPSEDWLFSGSYDNLIKCWVYEESMDDWICSYTIQGHLSTVWNLDFDGSGQFLCSASEDRSWAIWEISRTAFKSKGVVAKTHLRSIYSISWLKAKRDGD
jgi:WD40 repeat protein